MPGPIDCVLLDWAGTLAMPEPDVPWVREAFAAAGTPLGPDEAEALAARLVAAGRPGGPYPSAVPAELAQAYADRDLDVATHRRAYVGILSTVVEPAIAEALYERVVVPDGWWLYADTLALLDGLVARGVPAVLASNVGHDLRPVLAAHGVAQRLAGAVQSYEVGAAKPSALLFEEAAAVAGVPLERCLMVGDNPTADNGAAELGARTLLLPMTAAGTVHGLDAVLALVDAARG